MSAITEEMVENGVEEIRKAKHTCFDRWTDHDAIRAVLEASAGEVFAAKDAEIARLREALKPFARIAECEERKPAGDSTIVNIDRCRDALAALEQTP